MKKVLVVIVVIVIVVGSVFIVIVVIVIYFCCHCHLLSFVVVDMGILKPPQPSTRIVSTPWCMTDLGEFPCGYQRP